LFQVAIQTNKRTDKLDETNSRFFQKILRKHLKMYAYTTEDVIQRSNSKTVSYFSVQNLFLILLPEATMSKARKIIILFVRVHECISLFFLFRYVTDTEMLGSFVRNALNSAVLCLHSVTPECI